MISLIGPTAIKLIPLLFYNAGFDSVDDVADVIIGNVGTGWEADADFEESFRHAVDVSGNVLVYRLFVHRLPQWTGFDIGFVETHTQGFNVIVGLTVGNCSRCSVGYAGRSTDGADDDGLVGVLLTFDFDVWIENSCAEPEVGI